MGAHYRSLRRQTFHYLARPHEGVPGGPLTTACAWRGEELRRRGDWIERLDRAEVDEVKGAVAAARATGRPLTALVAADFPLPGLCERIARWRRELARGRGFVLLRQVPVAGWSGAEAETFFWGLGLHLGIPGAQNPRGDLLGHVRDERKGGDIRLYETAQDIAFHCDAADVVGLLCVHAARRGGASRIASSVTVFNELLRRAPRLVERLFQPFHLDTHGEGGVRSVLVPPCRYAGGELRTFWHSDYFRSAEGIPGVPAFTPDERALLDTYDAIAADPAIHLDMELEPGDVQLLSNHSQIHARTAYDDWPEPERRRHLLRLWLSLPSSRGGLLALRTMASGLSLMRSLVAAQLARP
jgi:hypothetical protein